MRPRMHSLFATFAGSALLMLACHGERPMNDVTKTKVAMSASPPATPASPSAVTCDTLTHESEARVAQIPQALRERADPERLEALSALLGTCIPARDGLWVLTLDSADEDLSARIALTFVPHRGPRPTLRVNVYNELCADSPCKIHNFSLFSSKHDQEDLRVGEHFDFDGDGNPEVELELARAEKVGLDQGISSLTVWSYKGNAIVRYAPLAAHRIEFLMPNDYDGDGRPDYSMASPYSTEMRVKGSDGCESVPLTEKLLLHSLPDGSFSSNDAVSAKHARNSCDSRLKQPLSSVTLPLDGHYWTLCQRMAGKSKETLEAEWKKRCPKWRNSNEGCGDEDSVCDHRYLYQHAIDVTPPVQFSP